MRHIYFFFWISRKDGRKYHYKECVWFVSENVQYESTKAIPSFKADYEKIKQFARKYSNFDFQFYVMLKIWT